MSRGMFVWYDLMTNDVEGAKAFYTETVGWKIEPYKKGRYTMFKAGDRPIGGVMELPEEAAKMGAPPHWLAYIEVPDVDATAKQAQELGAKLYNARTIPEVGRFAVMADPQGATFAAFTPQGSMDRDEQKVPGDISWNELNTTDWKAAWKFYSELFGWQNTSDMDMGPEMGTYSMFTYDGGQSPVGGLSNMAKTQNIPPHWLYYVTVDDLDAAVGRIKSKGGKILNGPMDVPGGDKVAQCCDAQGAAFAIHWANPEDDNN